MFCPRCGSQNEVGATSCSRCGSALPQPQAATPPAPPASGNVSSGDLPSSSEGTYIGGSSPIESPNYPGPPGQSPYGSPSQGYGGGQGYGSQQQGGYGGGPGYGSAQQNPGGGPGYGSGQGYGSSPGYGSGPGYGGGAPAGGNVPNYLVWSISATVAGFLFCCLVGLPLGIVAIVFSTQVNKKLEAGDYAGAVEASNKAKLWCIIATVVSALGLILNIIALLSGSFNRF